MATWVERAPDKATYRRRLAIWLIVSESLHVPDIARMLQVSTPAVWKWIQLYNATGPTALDGPGRGGRQRAYLTPREEAALLRRCERRAARGEILTAADLFDVVHDALGQEPSLSYIRRLLARHDWRRVMPRPRHARTDLAAQVSFPKGSRGASAAS
jgi:transposase